ncbi:T9SS type A sorting domain-containing protein [Flavobacterium sp. DG1-102-2]|uniref:T9SS type A sorting domain-containing protein n=1 Tax=Flavobacterium sp. DG1-102-2 TaxID=3081663 RepID=UPI002949E8ED|nr:T9SS type A sorting domain-containing protein [Flavobacterium sp. DG1-102-2]MDV6168738.1 T9SS type A sorting domain-containing protein [Flavobacterium sp. DG1-102-2]
MKKIYLNAALFATLFSVHGYAQNNYTVESIPYQVYATTAPFAATLDDMYSETFTIPFNFNFFGEDHNQFLVSTNGYIDFRTELAGIGSPWNFDDLIPNPDFPVKNAILGCYHDMNNAVADAQGTITWTVSGNAPYRQFVLMFNNQPHFSCGVTATSSFQVILYETYNYIDVQITKKDICTSWINGAAVVGIVDPTGLTAYAPPGRNTGAWTVTTGEGWRFRPQVGPVYRYVKCDDNADGLEIFSLSLVKDDLDPTAVFYATLADAVNAVNPIAVTDYANTIPFEQTTIYAVYATQITPVQLSPTDCSLPFDMDGVPTSVEDLNGDGNLANDDTDGDGIPNFIDNDDDGDLVPSSEEYIFPVGPPNTNDNEGIPLDTDGDGIPNYIDNDDDNDGILTVDEDYNLNGDPTDDDLNNNGVADYLDFETTAGIPDLFKKTISLYPNPSSDVLNIENGSGKEISGITVYSVNGVIVKQTANGSQILVSDLQSGIYVVKVQVDNQILNYKFIKK